MSKKAIATHNRTIKAYMVEGITTQSDEEIMLFCEQYNFGGYVYRYTNDTARVEVYID